MTTIRTASNIITLDDGPYCKPSCICRDNDAAIEAGDPAERE